MLQIGSNLRVADNSGAKALKIIGIPGASRQRFARLSGVVSCVVKEADVQGVVKDDEIVRAVIVRTKKEFKRDDGSYVRFDDNSAVIIDRDGAPRGSRIFGPVAKELKDKGFVKIASLAPEVI
ncbi:MAG: 50S ribosomal protein L14 [Candidatus Woykebacteria bacterium RBG_13_40_7b]|uniref:Large ribosomal subunit protein uL14 n=1 Tax=Candidatus Woykebacteria bacterium RBG_13_40_7b TaxID=1802594 RepID=A0A1G1W8T0_9BACT|nr:MAG: 50S ribosomal protein L14 [Candidatus Woykebacteria bacterium RBG_13_40_7b]